MSRDVITIPSSTLFGSFQMDPQYADMDEISEVSGVVDTVIYGHPRWRVSMSAMDNLSLEESSFWEYVVLAMKNKANRLAVFDPVRTAPRGTMRGSPSLSVDAAAGATSISVNAGVGQASTTLKIGDLLQIGAGFGTSQLVKVMADVTLNSSGVGVVQIAHYLRQAYTAGTVIIWDRPVAYFANLTTPSGWTYLTNAPLVSGFAFDLLEQWS